MPPNDTHQIELGPHIVEEINRVVERYGQEHPLIDELIQQRLMELLGSSPSKSPSPPR